MRCIFNDNVQSEKTRENTGSILLIFDNPDCLRYIISSIPAAPLFYKRTSVGLFFLRCVMQFTKPALTLEEQAHLLAQRGLLASMEDIKEKLSYVNYYRFSSYLYPFKLKDSE